MLIVGTGNVPQHSLSEEGEFGEGKSRQGWPCNLLTFFPLTDPSAGIWPGAGIGGDGRWFLMFQMEKKIPSELKTKLERCGQAIGVSGEGLGMS